MKSLLVQNLEKHRDFKKASRYQHLLASPVRFLYSKMIVLISRYHSLAVHVNAETFFGEKMEVVLPEQVSKNVYLFGYFEEGLTRFILQYLKEGMVFFDIGPHFGLFSCLASHIVGSSGQVHAFEPTKSTLEVLNRNASARGNICVNNVAVWSTDTSMTLNDFGLKYSAFNSLFDARLQNTKLKPKQQKVSAIAIDSYVESTGIMPDFVKIDAESAEYAILQGMENTIKKSSPILSIEVGDTGVTGAVPSRVLVEFLIERGYSAFDFRDVEILPHILKDTYKYENLLFIPS